MDAWGGGVASSNYNNAPTPVYLIFRNVCVHVCVCVFMCVIELKLHLFGCVLLKQKLMLYFTTKHIKI